MVWMKYLVTIVRGKMKKYSILNIQVEEFFKMIELNNVWSERMPFAVKENFRHLHWYCTLNPNHALDYSIKTQKSKAYKANFLLPDLPSFRLPV